MLRMSELFGRTLRDDPADAEVPSHALLMRAGYIRRVSPGVFTWLPLGWRVYRAVERVVREQMDAAGFQEVHFPALLPREPYERTHRWTEYGETLFRLRDRRGNDHLLGPTHEEMFTLLVKDICSSYRDLPVILYQIQVKYRDEARPRAGILRGREFTMKDSYSFDLDEVGLARSYQRHREAYIATFDRLGLSYVIVSATSGAMGGSRSEEFLAPCSHGEDTFVRCAGCGYAANVEAFTTAGPVAAGAGPADAGAATVAAPMVEVDTPGTPTIDSLVALLNDRPDLRREDRPWVAGDTLKNVVLIRQLPDGSTLPLVVGVPGDREVDLRRLEAALHPAVLRTFEDADFLAHPTLVRGYLGPQVLGAAAGGIEYLVDPRVRPGTAWVTGANAPGRHVIDLVIGRDAHPDGVIEAVTVEPGDPCPQCGAGIELARGIEIGHIFALGRKYAEALELRVLDEHGEAVVVTMGSYGIGVSRLVAAIAEQWHDTRGLCWPAVVAPADIHLIATGKEAAAYAAADDLAAQLTDSGLRVLYDDRPTVSPGVKFNDSELIGVPTIVVIGKRLAEGLIELKDRRTGDRADIPVGEAAALIRARVARLVHTGGDAG